MIFDGVDIEFLNIFIVTAATLVLFFAWKSTNVRDIPPTAVLIIENNRRRLLENVIRPHATIRVNNTAEARNQSGNQSTTIVNNNIDHPAPSLQDVLEEVSDLAISSDSRLNTSVVVGSTSDSSESTSEETNDDSGPQEIIENMDSTADEPNDGVRRRRLAFYGQENVAPTDASNETATHRRENLNLQTTGDSTHAENCSNENNENENKSKNESSNGRSENLPDVTNVTASSDSSNDEFVIKLKYLNDDLRLVKGSPQEALGDFKKRHFTVELAAEKLVRLVFNGHVLQPDSKTLQACGLFDNCVVHCLVHKRQMPNNEGGGAGANVQQGHSTDQTHNDAPPRTPSSGFNIRSELANGPLFVYFAVAVTSIAIILCWYCRFQYSSLFSLYSTIGLISMTALFLLIFPLVILIERDVAI